MNMQRLTHLGDYLSKKCVEALKEAKTCDDNWYSGYLKGQGSSFGLSAQFLFEEIADYNKSR